jgi:oligosaccharide translocation protein RFT1
MDKSASGFRAILSQQVLSRLITFILNIYLTRISTLGTMGLVLDMDLYLSTVLFLARESVRLSALRNPYTDKLQLLVNISYIPLALGSVLIFAFMNFSNPVLGLYSVAALIELASEPFYNLLQFKLLYGKRVHVQGLAFFLQCLCTGLYYFASLKNGKVSVEDGIHAHAYSQIVFSCILFGGYYLSLKNEQVSFFPRAVLEKDKWIYFDTYQLGICRNFMLQTLAKHLVTVGDKIILVFLGVANAEKGAYRLVSDLGTLIFM